eukprot:SAG22_NODE_4073_length_1396_cov_1.814187_2_plen_172_part_00
MSPAASSGESRQAWWTCEQAGMEDGTGSQFAAPPLFSLEQQYSIGAGERESASKRQYTRPVRADEGTKSTCEAWKAGSEKSNEPARSMPLDASRTARKGTDLDRKNCSGSTAERQCRMTHARCGRSRLPALSVSRIPESSDGWNSCQSSREVSARRSDESAASPPGLALLS